MALSLATKYYLWLLRGIEELGFVNLVLNHFLSTNNTSTDDLVHNLRISDKSKHIQVAYYFTRELVKNGTITVLRVSGRENLADICTKTIMILEFLFFCNMLIG